MGGAAALESRARLIARGTLIANNTATVGGGIATQFLASLQLEGGSIFTNNYASQGVYVYVSVCRVLCLLVLCLLVAVSKPMQASRLAG